MSPPDDCSSVARSWPEACWRPFAESSPFNRPIPAGAPLVANSQAIVQRMVSLYGGPGKMTAGDADTPYDYSHPLYYPRADDPVFTLHCYEASWGTCPIEGHRIRIPDAARPAGGGDAHMAVIDEASGWEYDLYKVRSKPAGGGTLEFRWGGRTRLDGDGLGTNATAAHFGLSAGIIRAEEMAAGKIDHALFMVVKCTSGKVYPALGGGAQCADGTDAPAGGMRFQLAYTEAEIEALKVPRWKKTILHALRHLRRLRRRHGRRRLQLPVRVRLHLHELRRGRQAGGVGEDAARRDALQGQVRVRPRRGRRLVADARGRPLREPRRLLIARAGPAPRR